MDGIIALALAKKYTKDTANSLGSLTGAPCTIKSTNKVDGVTTVVFEWEGNDGTKQTSQILVSDGKSAYEIARDNGFVGSERDWLDSLKMDTTTIQAIIQSEISGQLGQEVEDQISDNYATTDDIDGLW